MTKTFQQWDDEIKKEGLHIKWYEQIEDIRVMHSAKSIRIQEKLDDLLKYPDIKRKELDESGVEDVEKGLKEEIDFLTKKVTKLKKITELAEVESEIRQLMPKEKTPEQYKRTFEKYIPKEKKITELPKDFTREPIGTTYYIDFTNGLDTNDGLTTTTAWATLDKYTENTRSAGDVGVVRRGMAQTVTTDLTFTSDGANNNPIILEADYDDNWSDDTTATPTATFTFGSKTVTFSADVSSEITAGDWIYESTDDNRLFAYEVESVSTTTVTLYLPFKGAGIGSGKTVEIMPSNPVWGEAALSYEWVIDNDVNWSFQGLHPKGTDQEVIKVDTAYNIMFRDMVVEANNVNGDFGIRFTDNGISYAVRKCRFYHCFNGGITNSGGYGGGVGTVKDCLFGDATIGAAVDWGMAVLMEDIEFLNVSNGIEISTSTSKFVQIVVQLRNPVFTSVTTHYAGTYYRQLIEGFRVEDHNGVVGDNRWYSGWAASNTTPFIQTETTKVRTGGGDSSMKIQIGSSMGKPGQNNPFLERELFELPIQLTADVEKTATVYFASDDNTDWTANPTADELFVEVSYWGHATNKFRRATKSTGTIDFITDTDFDQTLSVTFTPLITGLAYIKVYYGKPQETGNDNIFYCDPKVVIS